MKDYQSDFHQGLNPVWVTLGGFFLVGLGLCNFSIGQASDEKSIGQKTFESRCVSCHGNNCKGKTITSARFSTGGMAKSPDLTAVPWKYGSGQSSVERVISEGVGRMPSHKDKISAAEIRAVASYMRKLCGVSEADLKENDE